MAANVCGNIVIVYLNKHKQLSDDLDVGTTFSAFIRKFSDVKIYVFIAVFNYKYGNTII